MRQPARSSVGPRAASAEYGSTSTLRSDEVEDIGRLAIELVVLWGGDTLSVSHFAAPSVLFVGEGSGCGVALPVELLGAERRCVAVASRSNICAVLHGGARGWITFPDGRTRRLDERGGGLDGAPSERAGSSERLVPLGVGYRAHLSFGGLEVQVAAVPLGRRCARSLGIDASLVASLGLVALTAGSVLGVLSHLTPALGLNEDERAESARIRLLHTYLEAATERAPEPPRKQRTEPLQAAALASPRARSAWQRTADRYAETEGAPVAVEPTLGIEAPRAPGAIERRTQLQEMRELGLDALLDWPELKDPTTQLERRMSGVELSLMQQLFSPDSAPLAEGPGGLAPSGIGIGGGGTAQVVALGAVRTMDDGNGGWLEPVSRGTLQPEARLARAPALRQVESIQSDPLAAASIRRALQAERRALRDCHAEAAVSGSVMTAMVRFVVQGNGQIGDVSAADPALPADVARCIERVFLGLSIPNPASRPVHVAYRVALDS